MNKPEVTVDNFLDSIAEPTEALNRFIKNKNVDAADQVRLNILNIIADFWPYITENMVYYEK